MDQDKLQQRLGSFGEQDLVKLGYFYENSFKHVYNVLDFNQEGKLNKSQLQVVCANVCRVLDILYMPEHLEKFMDDSKTISVDGFLFYVRELVKKAKAEKKNIDMNKLDDICWVITNKLRPEEGRILSGPNAFLLWKIFNKIDIHGELLINRDEVKRVLENFMKAIGTPWTEGPMENFSKEESWTFWNFLECIEKKYIESTPESLYAEGLHQIEDIYIKEIIKQGFLTKKGHKVKSLKERWFILQPKTLSYFTSQSMKELKGIICITKDSKVENFPDSKNVKCRFFVSCGEKNIPYELEADNQRTKNEWMNAIQATINAAGGNSALYESLAKRHDERAAKKRIAKEEELKHQEKDLLIKQQMEELERMKLAEEKAQAHAEAEAAILEEERKRREELEHIKEEYERLLEEERAAREAEESLRKLQESILAEERQRREDLENIKAMQEQLLEQEKVKREGLEEESKEQAKALEDERKKLKELDEARQKAEAAIAEAHAKLEAAEEERRKAAEAVESAKSRTRKMKLPQGLAKPLQANMLSGFVTHRGAGAFIEEDFKKNSDAPSESEKPEPVNRVKTDDNEVTAVIEECNLVKPSEKGTFLKDE